jgi:class 3 adenylate cyclase
MSTYSPGILAVRIIAEIEAKAGKFDAIQPEHLWIGLCKIVDLPEEVIAGMLNGQNIAQELAELKAWFASHQIMPVQFRRKLRELLGKGTGTKEHLHRSPESVKLFEAAVQLARQEGGKMMRLIHLARVIAEQQTPTGTRIVFSMMKLASTKPVALLVLDIIQSTQFVHQFGDTNFNVVIGSIYQRFKRHESLQDMIFLKYTSDGFFAAFTTIPAAFAIATTFLVTPIHQDVHVRMALHWGQVKTGPDGDVVGVEVQRVYRIEGVKKDDQLDPTEDTGLPPHNRILVSQEAIEQFQISDRQRFRQIGSFRLKGFDKPCKLWVYSG